MLVLLSNNYPNPICKWYKKQIYKNEIKVVKFYLLAIEIYLASGIKINGHKTLAQNNIAVCLCNTKHFLIKYFLLQQAFFW